MAHGGDGRWEVRQVPRQRNGWLRELKLVNAGEHWNLRFYDR